MMHPATTLNARGRLLTLDPPLVMGILNVTPDSFFDGGRYDRAEAYMDRARQMLEAGADIIDIGGMSTRPGAEAVSLSDELRRVIPAIRDIHAAWPEAVLSVDTVRSEVARRAVEAGASMVNDVSAGRYDQAMYPTVADLRVPYVLMHMQGKPRTMQAQPAYGDVTLDILDFFIREVDRLKTLGVGDIVLDPGFGFGKTIDHNYELLDQLHVFQMLDLPVLAGISRKSMIYKALGKSPEEALAGTTALHMVALQQGARLLRVHDVAEAKDVVACFERLNRISRPSPQPWPASPRTI